MDLFLSSVFLTILQIFSHEFTLIRDQGWINGWGLIFDFKLLVKLDRYIFLTIYVFFCTNRSAIIQ